MYINYLFMRFIIKTRKTIYRIAGFVCKEIFVLETLSFYIYFIYFYFGAGGVGG